MSDYQTVKELLETEQYDLALPIIIGMIEDNPNDPVALNFRGYFHLVMEDEGTAYQFLARSIQISPNAGNLVNMGKCLNEMGRHEEAINYFLKAAEMNPNLASTYSNASATLVQMSRWDDAYKAAALALECDPDDINARVNLAHAQLAKGEWEEGFQGFEKALGGTFRREWTYDDKGRWRKEHGNVVVYGEQGLGDEIYYAQAISDAEKYGRIIIDCDPKLQGLFRRSFPNSTVFGTRREENPEWLNHYEVDYRCAIGSLFHLFRGSNEDFKTTPYLVADPERRLQWRALFDSYRKPVIGLAFRSGTKKNNQVGRKIDIAEFAPLLSGIDAEFVSLEYTGTDPEGIRSYPWATRSNDYDDTAALISELDAVVGICTTALHCADALGVPTWTLVPEKHNWRFVSVPRMDNQRFVPFKNTWTETISSIVQEVKDAIS